MRPDAVTVGASIFIKVMVQFSEYYVVSDTSDKSQMNTDPEASSRYTQVELMGTKYTHRICFGLFGAPGEGITRPMPLTCRDVAPEDRLGAQA